jgi:hypothetical protein
MNDAMGVRIVPAPVQYAGSAPSLVCGVVQINFQVPVNISPGTFSFLPWILAARFARSSRSCSLRFPVICLYASSIAALSIFSLTSGASKCRGRVTALYTPGTNTWAAGPDITGTLNGIPSPFGADDAPAAILPNGHVIFAADAGASQFTSSGDITTGSKIIVNIPSTAILQVGWGVSGTGIPSGSTITSVDSASQIHISQNATATAVGVAIKFGGTFTRPTQLFDFNPGTNAISPVSPAIPDTNLNNDAVFIMRMLVLPTGQMLFSDSSNQVWAYTPDGTPSPALRPVINGIVYNGGGT